MRNENNKNIDNIVYQIVEGGGVGNVGEREKNMQKSNRAYH